MGTCWEQMEKEQSSPSNHNLTPANWGGISVLPTPPHTQISLSTHPRARNKSCVVKGAACSSPRDKRSSFADPMVVLALIPQPGRVTVSPAQGRAVPPALAGPKHQFCVLQCFCGSLDPIPASPQLQGHGESPAGTSQLLPWLGPAQHCPNTSTGSSQSSLTEQEQEQTPSTPTQPWICCLCCPQHLSHSNSPV